MPRSRRRLAGAWIFQACRKHTFFGSNSQYQVITLRNIAGGQYRLVVAVNSASPVARFDVYVREIPVYPALLACSAPSVDLLTNLDNNQSHKIDFDFSAMEWGSFTNVTNLQVAVSSLTTSTGQTLPVTSSTFTLNPLLAAGTSQNILASLLLAGTAQDGSYTGTLTITGRDAKTNAALSVTVALSVQIDRVAPVIPVISVSPIPASEPVTVTGVTEPNALVEIYLDDHYLLDITADDTGHFSASSIVTFLPGLRLGTAGNDSYTIRQDPTGVFTQFYENVPTSGAPSFFVRTSLLTAAINYNGLGGNDSFTIDFSGGNPLPATGLVLNGSSGTDSLRIVGTAANDTITVASSILGINAAQVSFSAFEQLTIDAGGGDDTITISSALPFSPTINAGAGSNTLNISAGSYRYSSDLGATSSNLAIALSNTAAIQFASPQHLASLSLTNTASVSFTAGGNKVLVTSNLQIAATATLDLADNDLIVRATPATRAAVLANISSMIRSARSNNWQGPGIASSAALTNDLATLAAAINVIGSNQPLFTQFDQQDVGVNDILVKYTWAGDANLDGLVNADDYFQIDSSFITKPANPHYYDGDFTYDGAINADDYFLIDSAFIGQSGAAADHLYITSGTYTFDSDPINGRANLNLHVSGNTSVTFSTSIHLASLSILNTARVTLAGATTVLRTAGLSIDPSATLDLNQGALVLQPTTSNRTLTLNRILGLIKSGYGSSSNPWRGNGITSTAARSNACTGLPTILNDFGGAAGPVLTSFAGELVNTNSILVKYTWTGDANLDGRINADDYFAIDSGFVLHSTGYQNGDFNLDGLVNADDYFLIDSTFVAQTGVL